MTQLNEADLRAAPRTTLRRYALSTTPRSPNERPPSRPSHAPPRTGLPTRDWSPRESGLSLAGPDSARTAAGRVASGIGECSVYVVVTARGWGVGTGLTRGLADVSVVKGFHKLVGKLFTDNAASIRLVERCGFSKVGVHRRHGMLSEEWRDVLVVERLLDVN